MEAVRPRGAHHCYLELHIEQGGTLEREGIPVGVVEGIVAIDRYEVTVTGFANHAGTTPMADRQDALLAASHLTIAVRQVVTSEPGRQVGTVGRLEVTPNSPERDSRRRAADDRVARSVSREARAARGADSPARSRDRERHEDIDRVRRHQSQPAGDRRRGSAAGDRTEAGRLGLATQRMPSGAGHDAQMMAQLSPMGMIFVPSVGGISHSPLELTHWDDCARGADVLLGAVLEMDRA